MIPLRVPIESTAPLPFVARLRSRAASVDEKKHPLDVWLIDEDANQLCYQGPNGSLTISGIAADSVDGDVLFVDPNRNTAHRLIRAQSNHNTLLITERCDQLCVMCSQPPKSKHVDMFTFFEAASLLAPLGSIIGLSGGEPTLYKEQLLAYIRRVLQARPDIGFHVLTNAQHLSSDDIGLLSRLSPDAILWGVPLYSAQPAVHDEIVGKPGAFDTLIKSLGLLCRAGGRIELRTVIMGVNAGELPDLARFITAHLPFIDRWAIMQMENIGYGRKNWARLFYDSSRHFQPVAAALDIARSRGVDAFLYNFPLCTVPDAYRNLAPRTISDWKQKYLSQCEGCKLRNDCSGFFAWHPDEHGFSRFGLQ